MPLNFEEEIAMLIEGEDIEEYGEEIEADDESDDESDDDEVAGGKGDEESDEEGEGDEDEGSVAPGPLPLSCRGSAVAAPRRETRETGSVLGEPRARLAAFATIPRRLHLPPSFLDTGTISQSYCSWSGL